MKSLYARYQKIAAGKFEVSQEEAEAEDMTVEDFANLNEVEQVLRSVGILLRDSVGSFRDFDEVLGEVAKNWNSFTEVQKSGIATSMAGTRQRENLLVLLENWDAAQKFEEIAANSQGVAEEKMLAYTTSVEAAQKRMTVAVEALAQQEAISDVLKLFYNTITGITENLVPFAAALTLLVTATNIGGARSLIGNTISSLGIKSDPANSNWRNRIKISKPQLDGLNNNFNQFDDTGYIVKYQDFIENQLSFYGQILAKNTKYLGAERQTKIIGLQDQMLNNNSFTKGMLIGGFSNKENLDYYLNVFERMNQTLRDGLIDSALATLTNTEREQRIKSFEEKSTLTDATERLAEARAKAAAQTLEEIGKEKELGLIIEKNLKASNASGPIATKLSGFGSLGGTGLGMFLGNKVGQAFDQSSLSSKLQSLKIGNFDVGSLFGDTFGQTIGTFLGPLLGKNVGGNLGRGFGQIADIAKGNVRTKRWYEKKQIENSVKLSGVQANKLALEQQLLDSLNDLSSFRSQIRAWGNMTPEQYSANRLYLSGFGESSPGYMSQEDILSNADKLKEKIEKIQNIQEKIANSDSQISDLTEEFDELTDSAEGAEGTFKSIFNAFGGWVGVAQLAIQAIAFEIGREQEQYTKTLQKMQEDYTEAVNEYNSLLSSQSDAQVFDSLLYGVDALGRNVSLTEEEYQKFLDASNALAEICPELVVRIDEEGNSIVGLGTKVGEVTDKIEEMTEASKEMADASYFKSSDFGYLLSAWKVITGEGGDVTLGETLSNKDRVEYSAYSEEYDLALEDLDSTKSKINAGFSGVKHYLPDEQGNAVEFIGLVADKRFVTKYGFEEGTIINDYTKGEVYSLDFWRNQEAYLTEQLHTGELNGVKLSQEEINTVREQLENVQDMLDELEGVYGASSSALKNSISHIRSDAKMKNYDENGEFVSYIDKEGNKTDYRDKAQKLSNIYDSFDTETQTLVNKLIDEKANVILELHPEMEEEEFKSEMEKATQEIYIFFKENPIIADIYYGNAEISTISDLENLIKEKGLKEAIESSLGADGYYDEVEKEILFEVGFKVVLRDDGTQVLEEVDYTEDLLGQMGLNASDNYGEYWQNYWKWNDIVSDLDMETYKTIYSYAGKGWINQDTSIAAINRLLNNGFNSNNYFTQAKTYLKYAGVGEEEVSNDVVDFYQKHRELGDLDKIGKEEIMEEFGDTMPLTVMESVLSGLEDMNALGDYTDEMFNELGKKAGVAFSDGLRELDKSIIEHDVEQWFGNVSGIEGIIDTWSELKSALEDIDSMYDKIANARKEQVATGKLSLSTIVDLLATDENYVYALENTSDGLKVRANAEQIMAEAKLRAIQASLTATQAEDIARAESIRIQAAEIKAKSKYTLAQSEIVSNNAVEEQSVVDLANQYVNLTEAITAAAKAKIAYTNGTTPPDFDVNNYSNKGGYTVYGNAGGINEIEVDDVEDLLKQLNVQYQLLTGTSLFSDSEYNIVTEVTIGDTGVISTRQGALDLISDYLENKDLSKAAWDKMYDGLGSGGGSDALENILKALDAIVDKEYEAMKVWDSINQKSLGDTEYYDKKAATLTNLLGYYNKMVELYKDSDQEKYLDYLQKQMDIEKQIANLNDEQVEDKINLLKIQKASLSELVEAQKLLIATSDTEEEHTERVEELNELYKELYELLKDIAKFEQESADYALEYLSGTAYSNSSMYDKYLKYKKDSIQAEIDAIEDRMAEVQANDTWSEEEKQKLLRELTSELREAKQALASADVEAVNAKVDEIQREIDRLNDAKPEEWTSTEQIDKYATDTIAYLEKQKTLVYDMLQKSQDLTDEEIEDLVDQYNDILLAIKEAQIQQLEDVTDYQDKQYDAIVAKVEEYKETLEQAIDDIEEAYDEEYNKLRENNEERERAIQLEDLLLAKKDAAKEKERVYREGLGWVYTSNHNKQKEAETNLEDFYNQDYMDDLEKTKEEEVEILQDIIDSWDKYLKALDYAHDEHERQMNDDLLMQLMGVTTQEEIYSRLTSDMQNFISVQEGNYKNYIGIFSDFINQYTELMGKLQDLKEEPTELIDATDYLSLNDDKALEVDTEYGNKLRQKKEEEEEEVEEKLIKVSKDSSGSGTLKTITVKDEDAISKAQSEHYQALYEKNAVADAVTLARDSLQKAKDNYSNVYKQYGDKTDLYSQKRIKEAFAIVESKANDLQDLEKKLESVKQKAVETDKAYKEAQNKTKTITTTIKSNSSNSDSSIDYTKAIADYSTNLANNIKNSTAETAEGNEILRQLFILGVEDAGASSEEAALTQELMATEFENLDTNTQTSIGEATEKLQEIINSGETFEEIFLLLKDEFKMDDVQASQALEAYTSGYAYSSGGYVTESNYNTVINLMKTNSANWTKGDAGAALHAENLKLADSIGLTYDSASGSYFDANGNKAYASGIENGPVTYTGLAMLHGTPTAPEYVLNSDQAYTLLRNISTTKMPEYESLTNQDCSTSYILNGDVVLENCEDPAQFWQQVTNQMEMRRNVTRSKK